jgi:tetratricopeptide (TPR) repeat protein
MAPDPDSLIRNAQAAMERQEFDQAVKLWTPLLDQDPDNHTVLAGLFRSLLLLRRFDRLEALLPAAERDPTLADWIAIARANLAEQRQDWSDGVKFWNILVERQPLSAEGYIGVIRNLCQLKRFAEADALGLDTLARFPDNLLAHIVHAGTANLASDYSEAARRWSVVENQFPDFKDAARHREGNAARARVVAGEDGIDEADFDRSVPKPALPAESWELLREDPQALTAFFMQFESLGRNCEFGGVQRQFGAEPISLLRWAWTEARPLINALSARFEGFGDESQTTLLVGGDDEYYLCDTRYGITLHTGVHKRESDAKTLHQKHTRRLRFLRDKLISDLTNQTKIFVFASPQISRDTIFEIHAAMSAYGPNRLLCVRLQDEAHPPGHVETLRENLLVGYLDREGLIDGVWSIAIDLWLNICEAAYRYRATTIRPVEHEHELLRA